MEKQPVPFLGIEDPPVNISARYWRDRLKAMRDTEYMNKWCKFGPYSSVVACKKVSSRLRQQVRSNMDDCVLDTVERDEEGKGYLYLRLRKSNG